MFIVYIKGGECSSLNVPEGGECSSLNVPEGGECLSLSVPEGGECSSLNVPEQVFARVGGGADRLVGLGLGSLSSLKHAWT